MAISFTRNKFGLDGIRNGTLLANITQFLFGTKSGLLYTINSMGTSESVSGFNAGVTINDIEHIPSASTTIVVGNNGAFYSSTNLTTWVSQSPANFGNSNLNVVKYSGSGSMQAYMVGG